MIYEIKEKLRPVLTRSGLLPAAKYIYRIHHLSRHLRHEYLAQRIRAGKNVRKFSKIKDYKDCHVGQRCFIVATGPSLTVEDVEKLKDEITFSMNSIVKLFPKTDWRPTYYGIQDCFVFDAMFQDKYFQEIKNRFVGDLILDSGRKAKQNDVIFSLDLLNHEAYKIKRYDFKFSDDASAIVYDGFSITYSLIQIAVYMGFKEIYLLGCDCDYSGKKMHFADYGFPLTTDPRNRMLTAYQVAKEYADAHGIKICNATRGGKLELFERVDLNSLF